MNEGKRGRKDKHQQKEEGRKKEGRRINVLSNTYAAIPIFEVEARRLLPDTSETWSLPAWSPTTSTVLGGVILDAVPFPPVCAVEGGNGEKRYECVCVRVRV